MITGFVRSDNNYSLINKAILVHSCSDNLVNDDISRLSPKLIAGLIEEKIRIDPTFPATSVCTYLARVYGFHVTYAKAWRTLEASRNNVFGGFNDSFDQLRWYADVVRKTNPGSAVDIQSDTVNDRLAGQCFLLMHLL